MIKYEKFEKEVFYNTLVKNLKKNLITTEQYKLYVEQHNSSEIIFTDNRVGFFFDYNDINSCKQQKVILSGGNYTSESHPEIMVEIILFIINDTISCMEGHGYGDYIDPIFFKDYIAK